MRSFGKLFVEARLMGGAVVSVSPCFSTQDPGDTTHLTSNLAPGFAWEFSAGAGYTVSKHFSFKLNLGLMGGWPVARKQYPSKLIGYEKYKDPITGITYDLPVYSAPIEYVIKKVITTFNPSIGFVYRF
jgi:hypothetical protein